MKNFIVLISLLFISIAGTAFGQGVCTIPCCDQCFPYNFCNDDGTQYVQCSKNPHADGNPAMSYIPNCVVVDDMRPEGIWQANTGFPPKPASQITVFDTDGQSDPLPLYHKFGAHDQVVTDSEQFIVGAPPIPPLDPANPWILEYKQTSDPGSYPDSAAYFTIENPADHLEDYEVTPYNYDPNPPEDNPIYISDSTVYGDSLHAYNTAVDNWNSGETRYNEYLGALAQYTVDQAAWITDSESYTQIWNQAQADTDASNALQNWRNACSPPVEQTGMVSCCLHIVMDTVAAHFGLGTAPIGAWAFASNYEYQPGFPTCFDTEACPLYNRFIDINVSNDKLYQTTNPNKQHPDSSYTLHPCPLMGFYTSETAIPTVFGEFASGSFYQTVEHEMGHFFGLYHPDQKLVTGTDTIECSNCYTHNPGHYVHGVATGYFTVMMPIMAPNQPPLTLSGEDDCQFQKLYCNTCLGITAGSACALDGVSEPIGEHNNIDPQIYPNPTSGECTLVYQVTGQSFVQVAVYDMLGNQVHAVSSQYEGEGQHTISLGTESLPSGNYVCRVRVGGDVSYINLVIKK